MRFLDGGPDRIRSVLADQLDKFTDLASERAVPPGQFPQVEFGRFTQLSDQLLLRRRPSSRRAILQQRFFETFGSQGLTPAPRAWVADDFPVAVLESDRLRVGLESQAFFDETLRCTVSIPIKTQAKIFLD